MRPFLTIILTLLLVAPSRLGAQRTADGAFLASAVAGTTLSGPSGELSLGRYLLPGYWLGAIGLNDRTERDVPSGETVHYSRTELRGGYLQRLAASYSRAFSLYAGADAFIGAERFDLPGTLSGPTRQAYYNGGIHDYAFIYGAAIRVEMELFFCRSAALILSGRIPVTVGTPLPLAGYEAGAGIRINLQ